MHGHVSPQQRQQLEQQAVRNAFLAGDCKAFHEELRSSLRVALSPVQPQAAASPSNHQAPHQHVSEENLRLSDEVPPAFALPAGPRPAPDMAQMPVNQPAQMPANQHVHLHSEQHAQTRAQSNQQVPLQSHQHAQMQANEPFQSRPHLDVPQVVAPPEHRHHATAATTPTTDISPASMHNSTPSSGRPGGTSRFHSANEETGFESASSNGQQGPSDDDRPLPSADMSKTSLTAAESETSVSTFSSHLHPIRPGMPGHHSVVHTIRHDHFDELSAPITPIAEDHGSVGNDEADDRQISESNSSEGGVRRGRPGNFAHARRAYLDEAALRASIREALAKGQSKSQPSPNARPPAGNWVTHATVPTGANRHAEADDHVQIFDTGYLNSDGSGSERDAEAYDSESESVADELDGLAEALQVTLTKLPNVLEFMQCALCHILPCLALQVFCRELSEGLGT